jgi:hypothetical protein
VLYARQRCFWIAPELEGYGGDDGLERTSGKLFASPWV